VQKDIYCLDYGANVLLRAGSAHTRLPSRIGQLTRQVQRHHQDRYFREHFGDLPREVDPVQIRHLVIKQDQVRRRFKYLVQSFCAGAGLSRHLPGLLLLQDGPQIAPDSGIIVDNENAGQAKYSFSKLARSSDRAPSTYAPVASPFLIPIPVADHLRTLFRR